MHLLLQYIQCLRKSGNIEKLRVAREEMNKYFPLTPKMWQEWAKDEISLSSRFMIVFYIYAFMKYPNRVQSVHKTLLFNLVGK